MNADHDGSDRRSDGWPDDTNRPVFADTRWSAPSARWWVRLGLRSAFAPGASANDRSAQRATDRLLADVQPSGFIRVSDGMAMSIDDVVSELGRVASAEVQRRADDADERRTYGWARVHEALSATDAAEPIDDGPWSGFTRGDARAWSWNLFQYEPHGFIHPGSEVRAKALRLLEEGGLPTVFGYPGRAAELVTQGLTPESYRQTREALGARTFSPGDVSFSTSPGSRFSA